MVYHLAPVSNYNENGLPFVITVEVQNVKYKKSLPAINKLNTVSSIVFSYLNGKPNTLSSYPIALYFTHKFISSLKFINLKSFCDSKFFQ